MKRKMTALVIGNANYDGAGALANPTNDAADIDKKLREYGFDVVLKTDASCKEMDLGLKDFKAKLKDNDIGLFFFAGHGIQVDGENYLIATDTDASDEVEAKHSSLALNKVIDIMDKSSAPTKIIILDACRDNPWERRWARSASARGLASVYAPKGTIICYATSPGQVASDGAGRNGAYTGALLQHIDALDCSIEMMFKRVRNTVAAATAGRQITWEHTSLAGEFYFNMSLGKIITEYAGPSLADALFVIDESRSSHRIIKGLKSHDWYVQNPAVAELEKADVSAMRDDNLFVVGRNIYQAACGGSHAAVAFIQNFTTKTAKYKSKKRKAILDGMLFEILFGSDGKRRKEIKGNYFDELFLLQSIASLKDSFKFISDTALSSGGNYYCIPGKGSQLSAAIVGKRDEGRYKVREIYVDGQNIYRPDGDGAESTDTGAKLYKLLDKKGFEKGLSEEFIVPLKELTISYEPKLGKDDLIEALVGYTVRKS